MKRVKINNPDGEKVTMHFPNDTVMVLQNGEEYDVKAMYIDKENEMLILHKQYTAPFGIQKKFTEEV